MMYSLRKGISGLGHCILIVLTLITPTFVMGSTSSGTETSGGGSVGKYMYTRLFLIKRVYKSKLGGRNHDH